MMLVCGPLMSGKKDFARAYLARRGLDFEENCVWDVQALAAAAADLDALAEGLSRYAVVVATETGGGVVPTDPAQRAAREAAGRLCCLLAARADTVVRVFCGLPAVLKGELPW